MNFIHNYDKNAYCFLNFYYFLKKLLIIYFKKIQKKKDPFWKVKKNKITTWSTEMHQVMPLLSLSVFTFLAKTFRLFFFFLFVAILYFLTIFNMSLDMDIHYNNQLLFFHSNIKSLNLLLKILWSLPRRLLRSMRSYLIFFIF